MNEFERRLLDTIEYNSFIATFAEPGRDILGIENYAYCVDAQNQAAVFTAAAGGPVDFDLIMDSDSDFVACQLSGAARYDIGGTPPGEIEFSPALLVQILDQSSGKTYFNIPTPMPLIAGAGGFPYLLVSPRVVKPRSTLTVSAYAPYDIGNTDWLNFMFAIHGAKIYYKG